MARDWCCSTWAAGRAPLSCAAKVQAGIWPRSPAYACGRTRASQSAIRYCCSRWTVNVEARWLPPARRLANVKFQGKPALRPRNLAPAASGNCCHSPGRTRTSAASPLQSFDRRPRSSANGPKAALPIRSGAKSTLRAGGCRLLDDWRTSSFRVNRPSAPETLTGRFRQLLSFARPNSNVGSQSAPVLRPTTPIVSKWAESCPSDPQWREKEEALALAKASMLWRPRDQSSARSRSATASNRATSP